MVGMSMPGTHLDFPGLRARNKAEEKVLMNQASRYVERHAHDAGDCGLLLDILGLSDPDRELLSSKTVRNKQRKRGKNIMREDCDQCLGGNP